MRAIALLTLWRSAPGIARAWRSRGGSSPRKHGSTEIDTEGTENGINPSTSSSVSSSPCFRASVARIRLEERAALLGLALCLAVAIGFLRLAENPRDVVSGMRVLTLIPGIGQVKARQLLQKLSEHTADFACWKDVPPPKAAATDWPLFVSLMRGLAHTNTPGPSRTRGASSGDSGAPTPAAWLRTRLCWRSLRRSAGM